MKKKWIFDRYSAWRWDEFFSFGVFTYTIKEFVNIHIQILAFSLSLEWRIE